MSARVYVVGSANIDRTVTVDRLPVAGETALGGGLRVSAGGKGANAAAAAAGAGARTTLIAAVGDDPDGARAIAVSQSEGVDVGSIEIVAGESTGTALIVTDPAGANLIAVAAGANARLSPAHVEQALRHASAPDVLMVSAEIPDAAIAAALAIAADRGISAVLDPAPARSSLLALLNLHPIVTPNEAEAATLTGESAPERAATKLAALTQRPAIVTVGADGCVIADGPRVTHHPAAPVDEVRDSVGAGDAFAGALAAALAARRTLGDAIDQATRAAADSLRHAGARP
ncbi:MAG TPA: PfkB family carbohydrate kinase [Solirubrobacteraceae bacterium]|jgi:ribokinase|nr:PfkB family carbohydrate kinase [Solirubrobacteraceae bacterium]